ncbi:MAG: tyrosine-type recombinase/integrase [Paludibacteraceae bacterium]|nr:tyrosine-type recombinase/integrase [Paludibacteraceae bacterium]MBO7259438.1 tyrosine-type recombinase/integrase [Paludibacteraceae bacterium]
MNEIDAFLRYLEQERRYSLHTIKAYRKDLEQFCTFVNTKVEDFEATQIDTADVREWIVQLMQDGGSSRTVCRKLVALRSFWKFLMMMGKDSRNIMRNVVMPKTKKTLPVFYRQEHVDEALQQVLDDEYETILSYTVINFLYQTGARRAELIDLKDEDVNLVEGWLKLHGKRDKERVVPFGDDLRDTLQRYRECRDAEVQRVDSGLFFLLKSGKKLYPKKVYQIVHEGMTQVCTQKKQSPHVLRHTFATQMLNNGADINAVKSLLGHASLAATQIYTHTTFEEIQSIYKLAHPRAQKKEEL